MLSTRQFALIVVHNSEATARLYCRVLAIVFAALTIFGLLPFLQTTFGLIPLFGLDVALHAVTAVALAYFGWAMAPVARIGSTQTSRTV